MAWIECHDTIWDHHKLYRLCTAVNQPDYAVVGRLVSLWHFVLQNAWRDSNLEPWGDAVIEQKSRWDGEKGVWIKALRDCGFMDGFIVHGWLKRAGRLVADRRRNERRKKRTITGGKTAVERRTTGRRSVATVPYPTVPNPTLPDITQPEKDSVLGPEHDSSPVTVEAVLPERRREKPVHVQFVDRWKAAYEAKVGEPFKADKKHFVIASKLLEKHGHEALVKKANTLYVLCRDRSAWFTKSGWGDFTLEKLSSQWNAIIPETRELTPEEEFLAELRKQEAHRERVDALIADHRKRG